MSLTGKTALITGAAGGLGRIIADMYLSRGANIVICDVNNSRLDAAREAYISTHPHRVLAVQADVSDEESVRSLIKATVAQFHGLHFVVNNAGIMDRFDPAGECDKSLWDTVLAVNLTGPFLVTKYAVAAMAAEPLGQDEGDKEGEVEVDSAGGLIVNIASTASMRGLAAGAAYSAAKHGVIGLTKNTAGSYGKKSVYAVALVLGGMDGTNIAEAFSAGINTNGLQLMQETMPGYRGLPADHVARYISFLSEDGMARSANGSCIMFNCNWPAA